MTLVGVVSTGTVVGMAVASTVLVHAGEPLREERVRCITPDCGRRIYISNARNYGAGPVCSNCYDRWFANED